MNSNEALTKAGGEMTTIEAARELNLAVRSVQLMVDRGELEAWKTPGGHRRISRKSVEAWQRNSSRAPQDRAPASSKSKVLLIEDSVHFQNLVSLVLKHALPDVDLHVAPDGISGLAMAGQLKPDVLLVDILLPGIDGAALIAGLRTSPQFDTTRLIVVTSLSDSELEPYRFALNGVPVVHKVDMVQELGGLVKSALGLA
ncbi:response regulator [Paracidovorax wautersii]|uniref:DNA binding domain-containing protein, excisionase family n=1 Tax=Paracidovorax wautersii TaxID=1177982 RepID=A0A1I2GB26_9BURK|nr:response regulator [Paracidovorax wautersii]SFF14329.1 DNA binding domain-containing protein, excisionase family [Paracidovorax wautersii]